MANTNDDDLDYVQMFQNCFGAKIHSDSVVVSNDNYSKQKDTNTNTASRPSSSHCSTINSSIRSCISASSSDQRTIPKQTSGSVTELSTINQQTINSNYTRDRTASSSSLLYSGSSGKWIQSDSLDSLCKLSIAFQSQ